MLIIQRYGVHHIVVVLGHILNSVLPRPALGIKTLMLGVQMLVQLRKEPFTHARLAVTAQQVTLFVFHQREQYMRVAAQGCQGTTGTFSVIKSQCSAQVFRGHTRQLVQGANRSAALNHPFQRKQQTATQQQGSNRATPHQQGQLVAY